MDVARALEKIGWRQGSILSPRSLPTGCKIEPPLPDFAEESFLIVLTQDCDLVQPDFSKEPFAEVLLGTPIAGKPDGSLLFGKNPRLIQFPIGTRYFEASCHNRSRLDRRILAQCSPSVDHKLTDADTGLIREWMAKRYVRSAFPHNLNLRLRSGAPGKAISKLLENSGHLFRTLYLMCAPAAIELPEDQPYRLSLWMAVATEDAKDASLMLHAREASKAMADTISKCPGVELLSCDVRHEGQITLDDLCFFSEWDFDHLTHREALQSA
jgi:hypothetical protein